MATNTFYLPNPYPSPLPFHTPSFPFFVGVNKGFYNLTMKRVNVKKIKAKQEPIFEQPAAGGGFLVDSPENKKENNWVMLELMLSIKVLSTGISGDWVY